MMLFGNGNKGDDDDDTIHDDEDNVTDDDAVMAIMTQAHLQKLWRMCWNLALSSLLLGLLSM